MFAAVQSCLKVRGGTQQGEMAGGKRKQFGKQKIFNLKFNGLKLTAKPEGEGQNKQELNKPENWLS
jgi:hypothetical protein